MQKLREFQEKVIRAHQQEGKSTIVVAPTGLGKTRAAILPFVSNENFKLGSRIIYALPIRALAKGVQEEFNGFNVKAIIHHGDEPESRWFSERAIITTVDQYFTAFAGAPLSWSSAVSHAAAGAALASYAVFDEIHLLNPKNGLQLLFAILKLRNRWNLPTTVMTATLPNSVIDFLEAKCGLMKIEASEKDIEERDSWRDVRLRLHDTELDIEELTEFIKDHWKNCRKIIVFVNTVERAISLYKKLSEYNSLKNKVLLAHSRFSKEHRKKIEEEIHRKFGKNSDFEGILITTQVAEAGLNISAPLVITELAPMDSLIQRAGRCARFRESSGKVKGEFVILKINQYAPYFDRIFFNENGKSFIKKKGKEKRSLTLSQITWVVLKKEYEKAGEIQLKWSKEKELINICLNAVFRSFLEGRKNIDVKKDLKNSNAIEDRKLFDILSESIENLLKEKE